MKNQKNDSHFWSKLGNGILSVAGAIAAVWFVSPSGNRAGIAHRLLSDEKFASSFKDGAFKHLHDSMGEAYKKTGVFPYGLYPPNFWKGLKLQNETIRQLKKGGVTWSECFHGQTGWQKAISIGFGLLGVAFSGMAVKSIFFSKPKPETESFLYQQVIASSPEKSTEISDNFHTERLQKQEADSSPKISR